MSHPFRDKLVFAFYTEIQYAHQKEAKENDFWQKVADDSVYTLWVQNFFVKISLSSTVFKIQMFYTVSEINVILHFL